MSWNDDSYFSFETVVQEREMPGAHPGDGGTFQAIQQARFRLEYTEFHHGPALVQNHS
jgi:hypothetical protein